MRYLRLKISLKTTSTLSINFESLFKQGLINPLINSTKTKTNKIAIPKNCYGKKQKFKNHYIQNI